MEVCGGQTHSIMHSGLQQLLPKSIELLHGPGCPVCVTPLVLIDKAIAIAQLPGTMLTTFGDMLRVPGSEIDLFGVRAKGGQVRTVYSPLDAVRMAYEDPQTQVVFFAIGFETTAPANLAALKHAIQLGLTNFSLLVSQVCVPPALELILNSSHNRVNAFLAAGHVCAVMGYKEYEPIAQSYKVPIAVTGFEPLDILNGIALVIQMLENQDYSVGNAYPRVVTRDGNIAAQQLIAEFYEQCDQNWRGIGLIRRSGWRLKNEFAKFDADKKFELGKIHSQESSVCLSGQVLQGIIKPPECPAFRKSCTPQTPLGATMVSSEGVCAAYYRYGSF